MLVQHATSWLMAGMPIGTGARIHWCVCMRCYCEAICWVRSLGKSKQNLLRFLSIFYGSLFDIAYPSPYGGVWLQVPSVVDGWQGTHAGWWSKCVLCAVGLNWGMLAMLSDADCCMNQLLGGPLGFNNSICLKLVV